MYHSFEDLEVWKRSCALAVKVCELLEQSKMYSLRDQMQRAAVSIASNIAEGSERTDKDFARFLTISRGSSAELRTQAYIACKIKMITLKDMRSIVEDCKEIAKMLFALSKHLRRKKKDKDGNS